MLQPKQEREASKSAQIAGGQHRYPVFGRRYDEMFGRS